MIRRQPLRYAARGGPRHAGSMALGVAALAVSADAVAQPQADWGLYVSLRPTIGVLDDGDHAGLNVFDRASRVGLEGTFRPEPAAPEVFWQVESGIDLDEGGGELANRDSFVGARGGPGALRFGFFSTPVRRIGRNVEQVFARTGDNRNMVRVDGVAGGQDDRAPGWDNRWGNSVEYVTPLLNGWSAAVQYASNFADDFGSTSTPNGAVSTSLSYARGGLWLAAGYEAIDQDAPALASTGAASPELLRLGGAYTGDHWVIAGLWQRAEDQQGVNGQDRDTLGGGGSYWLTNATRIGGQVYYAEDIDTLGDTSATLYAAELEHRPYPRTHVYLSVAHTRNSENARFHSTRGEIDDGPLGANSTSVSLSGRYDF